MSENKNMNGKVKRKIIREVILAFVIANLVNYGTIPRFARIANRRNIVHKLMRFAIILLALAMFSFSANAACETTIVYSGLCSPNGNIGVHRADGSLVVSEAYGTYSGCYNRYYSVEIGSGGQVCDWTPGEQVLFRINGNDVARVNWLGNDHTVTLNLGLTPACSDGIDNDQDGFTDYPNDPGCTTANDNDERNFASFQ